MSRESDEALLLKFGEWLNRLADEQTIRNVEAARAHIEAMLRLADNDQDRRIDEALLAGLDALAREPGLVEAYDKVEHDHNNLLCDREQAYDCIATLESRLARVREVVAQMPPGDACFACRTALAAAASPCPECRDRPGHTREP